MKTTIPSPEHVIEKNCVLVSAALDILRTVSTSDTDVCGVTTEKFHEILQPLEALEDWLLRCSFLHYATEENPDDPA